MQICNSSTMWNLRMIAYFVLGLEKSRQADCWASQWAAPQGKHHSDRPYLHHLHVSAHTLKGKQDNLNIAPGAPSAPEMAYIKVSLRSVQVLFEFWLFFF